MNANSANSKNRRYAEQAGTVLLCGTFGLLLFGPLAFGAVEPWSIFLLEAGSAALFLVWVWKQTLEGEIRVIWNPLFLPMAVFGLLVFAQLGLRRSAYPHDTVALLFQYISYAILCFLACQTLLRSVQARTLAFIFCIYGGSLAAFALIQGISSNGKLYWIRHPRMGGWIYGPYVNHNHYAGLMEMLVPIPLVLSLTHLTSAKTRNLAAAAAAVMVGTIFLSGSRGGMLAIMVELVILSVMLAKQKRGLRTAVGLGLFLAIVVGLLTWVGGGELTRRIASVGGPHSDLSSNVRYTIMRDGLRMFLKKPVFGWGLGAFPVVYPQFRSFYTNFFVNQAHNDYLQLLVEMGLLGFATMIWFVALAYSRAIRKIGDWTSDINGTLALTCMLGLTGILIHSMVDFNLQIPANAGLFYVVCTIAASEPLAQPARKRRAIRSRPPEEVVAAQQLQQPATNY